ncbi:hypothetical protein OG937_43360 [Streptomyces sp. NBC_00510]
MSPPPRNGRPPATAAPRGAARTSRRAPVELPHELRQFARAADGTTGRRETVRAQDLYVRTAPPGAWTGTLYKGRTFTVESK